MHYVTINKFLEKMYPFIWIVVDLLLSIIVIGLYQVTIYNTNITVNGIFTVVVHVSVLVLLFMVVLQLTVIVDVPVFCSYKINLQ